MYPQQQMMQQQQHQPQYLANICINQVDQSTFNPNLPNGNDLPIQVPQSQWLMNPQAQQLLGVALGTFRLRLQERAARSPLHTWAYNQISQNRFQNQIWQQWSAHLAGFLEFIMVAQSQNNPPQVAVPKAADTMFKCYLSNCVAAQPQLGQFIAQDQAAIADIQKYSQLFGVIMQDIQAYRSGRAMAPQQQMMAQQPQMAMMNNGVMVSMAQPGYGQLPAVGVNMNYGQPQMAQRAPMQLSAMAVGAQPLGVQPSMAVQPLSGTGNTGMDYGIPAAEPVPAPMPVVQPQQQSTAPLMPVESYGESVAPVTTPVVHQPVMTVEELDRPIPMSAKDVILDPHYHTPAGFDVDMERPYDIIHSPGGIVTRPAYQVPDWTVTRNDTFVYTQMVDPSRYIRFYTKWPDGMVQESIVEINDMMNYLQHEIDADLRQAATHHKGEVRRTALKIHTEITDMKPIAEVKELQLADECQPVKMSVDFQGTTDMENEVESRKVLRQELGLSKEAKLPSHEYSSTRTHLIDIDQDGFDALLGSLDTNDLQQVAKDFALHNRQGLLSARVYNFINQRLTLETNSFLKDAMSLDVNIDDFMNDIGPLFDHLNTELSNGQKYVNLLKEASSLILSRAVQLSRTEDEEGGDVTYSINDTFVNLQTGWMLADLTDAKLNTEAQLVSGYTHLALIDAIKGMYSRASAGERILRRFRVVTLDGAYLEIFKGVLVDKAFMFKRVA
jgi:hypothetical protein